MKQKCLSIWLAILAVVMAACQENENLAPGTGFVQLKVSQDLTAVPASGRSVDITRQVLAVDFCKADGTVAKHIADLNKLTDDRVLLEVGTYSVKVTSTAADGKLGFEQPAFYGESAGVAVQQGKTTPATVTCALTCVKVTTKFTAPVQTQFPVCVATVTDGSRSLDFDKTETRAGYFSPGYLLVNLKLANEEGVEFTLSKLIEKTVAKDHYALIFDLVASGDNDSSLDFDIKIETDDINKEEHTVTIPLPDTGYGQEPPVVAPSGNVAEGQVLTVNDPEKTLEQYNVSLTASSANIGINKVQLIVTSSTDVFGAASSYFTLSELSETDAAYTLLTGLGFTLPMDYSEGKAAFVYSFTPKNLPVGEHSFTLLVQDTSGQTTRFSFAYSIKAELSTEPIDGNAAYVWSRFATLRGYAAHPEGAACSFKYRIKDEVGWTVVNEVTMTEGYASAVVDNLLPQTTYEYAFVQGSSEGAVFSFTTDAEPQLTNSNFEDWTTNSDGLPAPWKEGEAAFWNTGNSKIGSVKAVITQSTDYTWSETSSKAVYMETQYPSFLGIGKLAAGNIFTGSFQLSGMDGEITFDRTFPYRPVQLKGYYQYQPAVVDNAKGHLNAGENDLCAIYMALTDRLMYVKTGESVYFDPHAEGVIAYGELSEEECRRTMTEYAPFTIDLTYTDLTRTPKYIIVVASSSKYGDYFEGATGSKMYLDDVSLVYPANPNEIVKQ